VELYQSKSKINAILGRFNEAVTAQMQCVSIREEEQTLLKSFRDKIHGDVSCPLSVAAELQPATDSQPPVRYNEENFSRNKPSNVDSDQEQDDASEELFLMTF